MTSVFNEIRNLLRDAERRKNAPHAGTIPALHTIANRLTSLGAYTEASRVRKWAKELSDRQNARGLR